MSKIESYNVWLFSERLHEARAKKGYTLKKLGALCGVTNITLWRYEHGASLPTSATLCLMAEALGVSADYLLGLSDRGDNYDKH